MDPKLFAELTQSLKEAKAVAQGHLAAGRRTTLKAVAAVPQVPDARAVRERIGLSQAEFAQLMRVSVRTLQNWEQHRRQPTGPAAALLAMASTAPELVLKTLHA